jgi:integrase
MTVDDLEGYVWGRHKCVKACKPPRFHDGAGLRYSMSEGAFNNQLGVLRAFLSWCHVEPDLLDVVSQPVKVRKRRKLRLSPDQIGELIHDAPDPWTRVVLALAVFTAGRSSELLSLTVGDVDLEAGVIEWERHKIRDDSDYLPITSELADELERWFKHYEAEVGRLLSDHYLIPRRTWHAGGYVYHPEQRRGDNLHKVIKPELARVLRCPESDLKQQGVHTLRRSMARALYERLRAENEGDPLGVVQALLGHSQRSMTEQYIGVESGREQRDSLLRGRSMFGG